jgi:hypothetical protein
MYNPADLSVLAYANNFTFWHYVTTDQSIEGENYFSRDRNELFRVNDLIIANVDIEGVPTSKFYIVTENKSDSVKISPFN